MKWMKIKILCKYHLIDENLSNKTFILRPPVIYGLVFEKGFNYLEVLSWMKTCLC